MNLPEEFLSAMKELINDEYDDFLRSYDESCSCGLRVNLGKISTEDFKRIAPYSIRQIPFIENGFYIDPDDGWSRHPYYYAGLYYLQEPSAMIPANRLPIEKSDRVLDLCAAPGGKATELSAKGPALIVANDISYSRTLPLVKNLEVSGAVNTYVCCEDPQKLCSKYEAFFDKIIVDAPCSGEGMFRKDNDLIKSWMLKKPSEYAPLQKQILKSALKMLKPGGMLMYSTCTFSDMEDEEVILDALSSDADLHLVNIDLKEEFSGPYDKYRDKEELRGCIHVFPHKVKGEGHFAALIKKESDLTENTDKGISFKQGRKAFKDFSMLPDEVKDFLIKFDHTETFENDYVYLIKDDMVYMLPEDVAEAHREGVRFVRTGTPVGQFNKAGRFLPHTAFALAYGSGGFADTVDFPSNSEKVYKYLKGETLLCDKEDDCPKGYVLVCTDGFPLGFAKSDGIKLKNLYEKGWRMQ